MFGLLYALNSYVVVYNHNVLWLDGLILLPFIAIAVEHLAEDKWQLRYTLLLACAFLFNYYFAFYICLFIICYPAEMGTTVFHGVESAILECL